MAIELPFRISVLVFVQNDSNEHLLIKRSKAPNKGCWSPIGGKLEMHQGESPYECARRETREEIGLRLVDSDLHCFGYISEKNYEGTGHWLMFLFDCKKKVKQLPRKIEEGSFAFFSRSEIASLSIPKTDRMLLWPYFDKCSKAFVGIRANCAPSGNLDIVEELQLPQLKGTV